MKNVLVALGMMAVSSMAFAQGKDAVRVQLGIKVNQVYKMTSSDTYRGDMANTIINLKVSGQSAAGEKLDYATGDVPSLAYSPSEIRVVNGDTLEMKDLKKGTVQTVKASINSDAVVVSSAEIGQSLATELKKQGQDLVNSLSLKTEDASLNYALNISDMTCAKTAKALSCDLSADLVLDIVGN